MSDESETQVLDAQVGANGSEEGVPAEVGTELEDTLEAYLGAKPHFKSRHEELLASHGQNVRDEAIRSFQPHIEATARLHKERKAALEQAHASVSQMTNALRKAIKEGGYDSDTVQEILQNNPKVAQALRDLGEEIVDTKVSEKLKEHSDKVAVENFQAGLQWTVANMVSDKKLDFGKARSWDEVAKMLGDTVKDDKEAEFKRGMAEGRKATLEEYKLQERKTGGPETSMAGHGGKGRSDNELLGDTKTPMDIVARILERQGLRA